VQAEEVVIHLPNGERVSTLINATPIYSKDGEIESVVATIQDITPLEELARLRAEFLGMVSHELRGPLTSIKGSAATALRPSAPLDPAETRQFFRIIEEQADHMRDLISNLLDLTRIEAGTLSIAPEQTDVAVLIDQAKNAFLSGGYRNVVEVDIGPDLPPVRSDGQRIVQVLHNLLTNASKYSREWSPIGVTGSLQDLHVVVSVTDQGRGISADRLPHLFSKFSRTDGDDRDERAGGYGLGLAICRGIVEAHGGRIWAESDGHGRGTRFTFTIPTVDDTDSGETALPAVASAGSGDATTASECILAIDDDPQVLRYVRNTLSEAGYTPILTGDPDEMDQLLKVEKPDLVLLNLVLPGTDGFELMKRIPDILDVPIIVLSGRGKGHDITRAFELGAADYVVKPFSPTELVARLKAALRKGAVRRQPEPFSLGDVSIDYMERIVTVSGRLTQLTPTEYKLLYELSTNAGRVLTHDKLLQRVWGEDRSADLRVLRSFVKSLRYKLGDDARNPSYIFTEPSVGYRLAKP
jgi:DNA-binding response OmpR family regulator/nitrogen-specific signal transduction histidine kinase